MCQGQCQLPPCTAWPEARDTSRVTGRGRGGWRGVLCAEVREEGSTDIYTRPATPTPYPSMWSRSDHITAHIPKHHMAAPRCTETSILTHTSTWTVSPSRTPHTSRGHGPLCLPEHTPWTITQRGTQATHSMQMPSSVVGWFDGTATDQTNARRDSCHSGQTSRERISGGLGYCCIIEVPEIDIRHRKISDLT